MGNISLGKLYVSRFVRGGYDFPSILKMTPLLLRTIIIMFDISQEYHRTYRYENLGIYIYRCYNIRRIFLPSSPHPSYMVWNFSRGLYLFSRNNVSEEGVKLPRENHNPGGGDDFPVTPAS